MKSILYALGGIVFLIASCSPPVVFDQPYPLNGADLLSIPSAYQGAFICESDSSLVLIQDKQIVVRQENYFLLPLKDVEEIEDCSIQGDEMYVSGRA
ncbi:MAG: hypothetical protein P1U56_19130, partial [Saprospiraceae bacterium]|nr:hypothetical protein [Saprospiraceae bacterium]